MTSPWQKGKTMTVSFDTTIAERATIKKIAERAKVLAKDIGSDVPVQHFMTDVTAVHVNDCPLDLNKLLKADDSNLAHDVFGIDRHLNRETGKLENCFVPRCTA